MRLRARAVRWHQFSRRGDGAFLSLGKEIVIGVLSVATLASVVPSSVAAQTAAPSEADTLRQVALDDVEVTASRVPMPMEQTARLVRVLTREDIQSSPAPSVNDLLQQAAAIDVRQRGAFGIQTDISINGGTHDQIVILLNGINISSPHTGHLAADFPLSVDDIERIEVLQGAASRIYGTSAFSGAINIVTKKNTTHPTQTGHPRLDATLAAEGGSFGTWGGSGSLHLGTPDSYHNLSLGYQQSDGGTSNSDFAKRRAYYNGGLCAQDLPLVDWQLGYSNMDYGANTFYSGKYPNQWEENERYTASVTARTRGAVSLAPTLYFNRAYDHYQLIKGSSTGENHHRTDVYGAALNATIPWQLGTTALGAELRNEGILSTSLGRPLDEDLYVPWHGSGDGYYTNKDNRTNICYFLEHDLVLARWTFSVGLMANMNTALDHKYRLYPGIDIAYRPARQWKLYASLNKAQRMPTFTDLYYKSPTNEGNTGLRPEETTELALGARFSCGRLDAEVRLFHRHQRDMIDWVMTPADSTNGYTTYHATNFKVDNYGANLSATLTLLRGPRPSWSAARCGGAPALDLAVDYAYVHQRRHDDQEIYASSYALDYLRHKLTARLNAQWGRHLSATLAYRWQQRMGSFVKYTPTAGDDGTTTYAASTQPYHPYSLLDLKLQWRETGRAPWEVYLQANNLTCHRYYDIGNVRQPGLWLMAGIKVHIKTSDK